MAPTLMSAQDSSEPPLPQSAKSNRRDTTVDVHALHGVAYEDFFAVDVASPATSAVANFAPVATPTPIDFAAVSEFLLHRQAVTRFVRDALQVVVDRQKANADRRGRKNTSFFRRGERVLLSTEGIQGTAVTNLGANKLAPRFIEPFKILKVIGDAYTLDIPTAMRLHPTFYVGCLKPYVPATIPAPEAECPQPARSRSRPAADADAESARALTPGARASPSVSRLTRQIPSDGASPSSRAAPAPIETQQLLPSQHARMQTQRGSEPPSRRPSPGQSPAPSADIAQALGAPRRRPARSQAALQQTRYRRDEPPPLVDASGACRYVVERLVDHDTRTTRESPPRGSTGTANTRATRRQASEKHYRVRWLGHSPAEDTWESRSRLLEDVPDLVSDYEASLARPTTSAATTCCNFKISVGPVVAPEPATLIFAQRPVHHLALPLFACRPRTILAPGAAFDQVHIAQTPLALRHLAHTRTKVPNSACAARGFTVFEPRRQGQVFTPSGASCV
ncbi:hypothetical protein PF008_g15164 [Phytophthora fragariae]|uniref:Chromo domain-containing protein n=1 Tax=Phytophthora fragariae TaxID=53985 RepID=A0A6G0RFR8_9STRA|nr:hypothetical protein PF008_g15164 [Phytophthora fragariae]